MSKRAWFDVQLPALQPLWLRVAIVTVALGWALFELSNGNVFWSVLFGAAGLYLAYQFFVVWDPKDPEEKQ